MVSNEDFDEVITSFRNIISRYGPAGVNSDKIRKIVDSSWLSIASLYLSCKDFESTQEIYDEILRLNPANELLCASARFSKAMIYEKMNRLNCALVEYKIFFVDHKKVLRDSIISNLNYLETPLKIARLYSELNNTDFKIQYKIAREFYFDLASSQSDSRVVSSIYHLLALTYSEIEDWENTVTILRSLVEDHPDTSREPFILYEIANITANQLKQKSKALEIYDSILAKYSNHYLSAYVNMNMGDIYFKNKLYKDARKFYKTVINEHGNSISVCSVAHFGIGMTFEKDGEWEKALNEFEWIWDNYTLSREAMLVPIYISKYYQRNNMKKLADKSFEEAIQKYHSFYENYSKNNLAPISLFQQAVAYENLFKWENALEILKRILDNHSEANIIPDVYLHISGIYLSGLKQNEKALQFYRIFYDRFPNHPALNQVERKINQLTKF